jgi:hypothetical protein
MSIKRTIITTLVALAVVAVVAPVSAFALSAGCSLTSLSSCNSADLTQLLSTLTQQVTALQGNTTSSTTTTTTTGSAPAVCAGVTFTRNLTTGSVGSDVKCLQALLNTSAATQVATTGAGSPGNETSTFGPRTLVAVRAYQVANGFTPANQVGPLTRAKLNSWLASGTTTGTTTTTTGLPAGCASASQLYNSITGLQNCGTGVTTTSGSTGAVSAMLASDTPPSGAVIGGQATADLLHVNFTGSGTVTSVTLQRSGISDQNLFTNVYLYDGNTRITDGYSFNVNGQIVINGLSIAVNGSHEISVRGDVECNASSGICTTSSTEGSAIVSLTSFTANGTAVSTSVTGNQFAVISGSLATVSLTSTNTVTGSPTVNSGTTQYTLWSAPLQVNTRSVVLKAANFKMIGSAPTNAISNIHMFIDGVDTGKVATVVTIASSGSNYASFDFSSAPLTLTTGSHTLDVRADIVGGASRTVQVSVQQASDLTITDPQVGVNIAVGGNIPNTAAQININQGSATVSVDPTFSSQTDIAGGATNAVIGRYVIQGYGEDVKIQSVIITPTLSQACTTGTAYSAAGINGTINGGSAQTANGNCTTVTTAGTGLGYASGNGLQNVTLYFNGSQIGSQQAWTSGPLTFQLGSQAIAPAGQASTLEVRADLQANGSIPYTAGTVGVILDQGSYNAQGQSSQTTFNVPTGNVPTSGLSISSGQLQVSTDPGLIGQSIPPNSVGPVLIGSYVAQNNSTSESIRLISLYVDLNASASAGASWIGGSGCPSQPQTYTPTYSSTTGLSCYSGVAGTVSELSGLYVKFSDSTSQTSPIQPSTANTFSINDTLAPGAQVTIGIYANTLAANTGDTVRTTLQVSSIGSTSNVSATMPATAAQGQIMQFGTGALAAPSLFGSSTTNPQYIATGSTGATNSSQATFNFVSTTGITTINELKFEITTSPSNESAVTNVCVSTTGGSAAVCKTPAATSTAGLAVADVTGLNLAVANNGGLPVTVQMSYAPVGTSALVPGTTSKIDLAYIKSQSGGVTSVACPGTVGGVSCTATVPNALTSVVYAPQSGVLTLVGSVPTVAITQASTVYGLNPGSTGAQQIGQVTVSASTLGQVRVHTLTFSIGSSGFDASYLPILGAYTATYLTVNGSTVNDVYCTPSSSSASATNTVTCTFTSNGAVPSGTYTSTIGTGNIGYGEDYPITAGGSSTFNLFTTVGGAAAANTKASVSSSVTPGGFVWDDSSTNGASGTQLNGTLINNFPTNSYVYAQQ